MTTHNQYNQPSSDNLTPLHDLISASRLIAHQTNLAHVTPQPINWLWPKRIPLSGITLLDGDHLCGKTLLTHQIAAAVSSGTPMPDGSPTIQGNVILITPDTDHTATQLQQLTALGANLDHIEFLSFVQEPAPTSTNSDLPASVSRPFCLPEDLNLLIQTIERVNARLVIFDPFIKLLSRTRRITNERLCHLLSDLNLYFIEHHIACLLIRNCPARGGHARPSVLERSDHFLTTAASRLLLTPDPFLPDRLLLCHALNRHAALTPTLISHIQPDQHNADLARFTFLSLHSLRARDFIENRPDTLHRQILSQHLLTLLHDSANAITDTKVIHVSTLKAHCPNSSPFQIQRSLNDLLNMGQIERAARGLYTLASPDSVSPSNTTAAIPPTLDTASILNSTAATTYPPEPSNHLNSTAAITPICEPPNHLNSTAAIPPTAVPPNQPDPTITTPPTHIVSSMLHATAAIPPTPQPPDQLKATAATTFTVDPALTSHLSPADAALYKQVLEANWRMTYMDEPRDIAHSQEMQRRKNFWNVDYGD